MLIKKLPKTGFQQAKHQSITEKLKEGYEEVHTFSNTESVTLYTRIGYKVAISLDFSTSHFCPSNLLFHTGAGFKILGETLIERC